MICLLLDTKLEEMSIPESKVLEKLNAVSTAKRLANMVCLHSKISLRILPLIMYLIQELHDQGFGKREEIHQKKAR
jgi:ATP-dependent RNA helicase DDX49/DBP8